MVRLRLRAGGALVALLGALLAATTPGADAATTVTIGAPDSVFANTGSYYYTVAPPTSDADVATSPLGWNYAIPSRGRVTQVRLYRDSSAGTLTLFALTGSGGATDTVASASSAISLPADANVLALTSTVTTDLAVEAGQVLGLGFTGFGVYEDRNVGYTSSEYLISGNGTPAVGDTATYRTSLAYPMIAQYLVVLAPVASAPPAIAPTSPITGVALSASTGTWSGSPTGYAYRWYRCDAAGAACAAIAGATAASYTPTDADADATLRVGVIASNEGGSADEALSAATAATISIADAPASDDVPRVAPPATRVTYCHGTAAGRWTLNTSAVEIVFRSGHVDHARDIIPPFTYLKNGVELAFAGRNWDADGERILAAGCVQPAQRTVVQPPPPRALVTLCHATGSALQRLVLPAAEAYRAHGVHADDIIPPFSTTVDGRAVSFLGQNWTAAGQEVLGLGCVDPDPTEQASPARKVTICHRVGGPHYVIETIAVQAAYNAHARNHPLDIIPPFTFQQRGRTISFPGKNWTRDGRSAYRNGCVDATPPRQPVTPTVQCVDVGQDGSFTAYFGYASRNARTVSIAIGAANAIVGGTASGQPTTFAPGTVDRAVAVSGIAAAGSATWTIEYAGVATTATATSGSTACSPPPTTDEIPIGLIATCSLRTGSSYTAVFGYQSDAAVAVTIPAGADNAVALSHDPSGPVDRGQPATFAPGRVAAAFEVRGVPVGATASWSVTIGGSVRVAIASAYDGACRQPETPDGPAQPPTAPKAQPLGVAVTCVRVNDNGTYDAVFGYANPNPVAVDVALGAGNETALHPAPAGPASRGQTTTFLPGSTDRAWFAEWIPLGQTLTWTVAYEGTASATATPEAPACSPTDPTLPPRPEPPVEPQPEPATIGVFAHCVSVSDGTYSVTFGYISDGVAPVAIPVGRRNAVAPPPRDRGQPTAFLPGSHASAFTIRGIPLASNPTWRVRSPSGTVAIARAEPTGQDCVTGSTPKTPTTEPELPTPGTPPREGEPTPIPVVVTNPDETPATGVVVVVPTEAGFTAQTIVQNPSACVISRGRVVLTADTLLPGQSVRCVIRAVVQDCRTLRFQAQATTRTPSGRISAATGAGRTPTSCRPSGPDPVTG